MEMTLYLREIYFQVLNIMGNSRESGFHLQFHWNHKLSKMFCPEGFRYIFQSGS